jgi:hypothetical protein
MRRYIRGAAKTDVVATGFDCIKTQGTINLSAVFYRCETWSLTLR